MQKNDSKSTFDKVMQHLESKAKRTPQEDELLSEMWSLNSKLSKVHVQQLSGNLSKFTDSLRDATMLAETLAVAIQKVSTEAMDESNKKTDEMREKLIDFQNAITNHEKSYLFKLVGKENLDNPINVSDKIKTATRSEIGLLERLLSKELIQREGERLITLTDKGKKIAKENQNSFILFVAKHWDSGKYPFICFVLGVLITVFLR